MIPMAMQCLILDVQVLRDGGHPGIADDLERAIHAWRLDRARVVEGPRVVARTPTAPPPGLPRVPSPDAQQGSGSWVGAVILSVLGFCLGVLVMAGFGICR